jgi:hypothetical protein
MTNHDPRADRRSRFLTRRAPGRQANSRGAVRYRSRREPRPDRSPRSKRSFAPSATYGNSASSRALDSARELALMAAARSRDPPRADLAALGDEPAQRRNVLVVDLVDLVAAVRAGLAPTRGRSVLLSRRGRAGRLRCFANRDSSDYGVCCVTRRRQTVVRSSRRFPVPDLRSATNRRPGPRPRTPSPTRLMIRQDKRNSRSTRRSGTGVSVATVRPASTSPWVVDRGREGGCPRDKPQTRRKAVSLILCFWERIFLTTFRLSQ